MITVVHGGGGGGSGQMIAILQWGGLADDYRIPRILGYIIWNNISKDLKKIRFLFDLVISYGGICQNDYIIT